MAHCGAYNAFAMKSVYVSGIGMTRFGKDPRPLPEILCEAARQALADSENPNVEALYVGAMNPEEFTGGSNIAAHIADLLGLTGIPAVRIETASSAGAAAVQAAFQAIASGYYRRVLVLGGEKMTHLSTQVVTRVLAEVIDPDERRCGATMPALAAMIAEKYRQSFRLSRAHFEEILCSIALKNHLNGSRNPLAQFQRAITREDYFSSKWVATPLRLYDCSPMTDGAAALVLTREPTGIRVAGIGQGTGPLSLGARSTITSFQATRIAAARAYQMAETDPKGIDFAEIHDAFTPFELITSEDLGFFTPGQGGDAVLKGKTAADGSLPINPSGGLKSRGHPVGASGLAQLVEAVKILRGETRTEREFRRGLTQSTGGLGTNNLVAIVEQCGGPVVQNPGLPFVQEARPAGKPEALGEDASEDGRVVTFTKLHVTPEGFAPPLLLALIRCGSGQTIIARGENTASLKIGQKVSLRRAGGVCLFVAKTRFQRVHEYVNRFLRRKVAADFKDPVALDSGV